MPTRKERAFAWKMLELIDKGLKSIPAPRLAGEFLLEEVLKDKRVRRAGITSMECRWVVEHLGPAVKHLERLIAGRGQNGTMHVVVVNRRCFEKYDGEPFKWWARESFERGATQTERNDLIEEICLDCLPGGRNGRSWGILVLTESEGTGTFLKCYEERFGKRWKPIKLRQTQRVEHSERVGLITKELAEELLSTESKEAQRKFIEAVRPAIEKALLKFIEEPSDEERK